MQKKLLLKLALPTIFFLFFTNASAQNEATFVEKDLPGQRDSKAKEENLKVDKKNLGILDKMGFGSTDSSSDKKARNNDSKTSLVDEARNYLFNSNQITSLMFDDEENGRIEGAIESLKNNQVYSPNKENEEKAAGKEGDKFQNAIESERSHVYLASIIYFSPANWSVWINNQRITPENNGNGGEFYVKSVQRDKVSLIWRLSVSKWRALSGGKALEIPQVNQNDQVETQFDLKPNQTFILGNKNIVEGRAIIALLKKRAEEEKNAKENSDKAATDKDEKPSQDKVNLSPNKL